MVPRQRTGDVTDPEKSEDETSKAVALSYEHEVTNAPRVVAKGRGALAKKILEIAFAAGIPVREDADLVEVLHAVDLDTEIPLEAFRAVAEILAYVYRANGTMPPSGAKP